MGTYFIDLVYYKRTKGKYAASSKATSDVALILKENKDIKQINITKSSEHKIWGNITTLIKLGITLYKLPKGSIVYIQYPILNIKLFSKLSFFLKRHKIIAIIHDAQTYRYQNMYEYRSKEIKIFNIFSHIILHTEKMKERLIADGLHTTTHVLRLFDYLLPEDQHIKIKRNTIVFAGALQKSLFLKDLHKITSEKLNYNLYGAGIPDIIMNENIHYKGCFLPNDITSIEGEWGLLWDGNSINTCDGQFGEYLQWIAPHKFSLYIACGLKIIAWEKSAMASVIKNFNIGITITSLKDIEEKIIALTKEDIAEMENNVRNLSKSIRRGEMLKNVLQQITIQS